MGLMVLAAIAAFVLPFEVFLFSYAVLGPLHYLTEIGWLHKKGFYTTGKNDFIWLVLLGLLITLGFFQFDVWLQSISTNLIFIGFLSALVMVAIKDNALKIAAILAVVVSTFFFRGSGFYEVFFAIFLPTIIHVFLFTGLFMLYGALKSRSIPGVLSVVLLSLCALAFFWIPASYSPLANQQYLMESYGSFAELNRQLINLFGLGNLSPFTAETTNENITTIFMAQPGFMVMRFVAFAYTYHYLNWFSKTSVIQWHKVPKPTLYFVLAIWALSVALYMYSYEVGLKWLFLLSFLHVLLEFPLNYRSIVGIFQELKVLASGGMKSAKS